MNFLFSYIVEIVNAHKRARIRKVMRGYRLLRESGRIDAIHNLKSDLTRLDLGVGKQYFSPMFLFSALNSCELVLRQYLLVRIAGVDLNAALLMSVVCPNKGVVHAMPGQWRALVEAHGFRVNRFRCALLWGLFVCRMYVIGLVRSFNIAASFFMEFSLRSDSPPAYAYFADLVDTNLPKEKEGIQSHDIVSWYIDWSGRSRTISCIRHSAVGGRDVSRAGCKVQYQVAPLLPLPSMRHFLRFVFWFICAAFVSAFDLFRGRWWHSVLLNQAAAAAQANFLPFEKLAREYWFHNSNWIYRPLWTYEVQRRGAEVFFYFYSTNAETFKQAHGYPAPYYGYEAMSWPHYLVWDSYQAEFVRRVAAVDARIDVVGPIWFQSSCASLRDATGHSIALFDVTPKRTSQYRTLALDIEFYVPETVNSFLEHVCEAAERSCSQVLWKRKREIGRAAHPRYRSCAERLGKAKGVTLADPGLSAISVIEKASVTISLPFTSTALLARHMGKPSAYYDPTGTVQLDDRAAHGIPVLSGPEALEVWLQAQFRGQDPAGK